MFFLDSQQFSIKSSILLFLKKCMRFCLPRFGCDFGANPYFSRKSELNRYTIKPFRRWRLARPRWTFSWSKLHSFPPIPGSAPSWDGSTCTTRQWWCSNRCQARETPKKRDRYYTWGFYGEKHPTQSKRDIGDKLRGLVAHKDTWFKIQRCFFDKERGQELDGRPIWRRSLWSEVLHLKTVETAWAHAPELTSRDVDPEYFVFVNMFNCELLFPTCFNLYLWLKIPFETEHLSSFCKQHVKTASLLAVQQQFASCVRLAAKELDHWIRLGSLECCFFFLIFEWHSAHDIDKHARLDN